MVENAFSINDIFGKMLPGGMSSIFDRMNGPQIVEVIIPKKKIVSNQISGNYRN